MKPVGAGETPGPGGDGTPAVMLRDPGRALLWAGGLLGACLVLLVLVWSTATRSVLQRGDDEFLDLMRRLRWSPLTAAAKALAFAGGVWVTWAVRGAVAVVLTRRRHWIQLSAFALAIATSEPLIGILKALYGRPRPQGSLIASSGSSFPSGHAIAAAVTAVGLVLVLLPPGHARWVWERRAVGYASLMALSRTYLAAHWLSDVVTGALLGGGIAVGWPALLVGWRARVTARRASVVP
jgi:membrane-associated phospholipid phosphatase